MTGLEKVITEGAVKASAEKTEGLLKALFGKAFAESAEMIADQVRLRRFKNQIKIFEKAKQYLTEKKINPQKINLKVLAPLIEFSSYEEDESLQELWAKLINNVLSRPTPIILQQNAIEVLKKVSNEEVKILKYIFDLVKVRRQDLFSRIRRTPRIIDGKTITKPEDYRIEMFSFKVKDIAKHLEINEEEIEVLISNLVALGTINYETTVDVSSAEKSSEDPTDSSLDIDLDVSDYHSVRLTQLGYAFIKLCTE
jgi:hypothetical protein